MTCLAVAGRATTSMPPTSARPSVGMTRVVSMPTVVVLPAPFGPSSPKISPRWTRRLRFSTARSGPAAAVEDLGQTLGDDDVAVGVERACPWAARRPPSWATSGRRVYDCGLRVRLPRVVRGALFNIRVGVTILPAHVRGDARRVQRRPRLDAVLPDPSTRASAVIRRVSRSRPTTRRRSCSTSAPACARTRDRCDGRVPRHGAAVAPALGSRAGPAVLHAAAPRGRDARRLRAAPGRRPARRGLRADDAAAVLPDHARPAWRPTCASTAPARTTSRSAARRCARAGCATSARRSASGSRSTASSVAYIPDHGPGCNPEHPDDYIPHEMLELCDGVDVLIHDAQHTPRRVRAEAALGSLHRRLRGARRPRGRRAPPRALPPRSRARRRRPRRDRARRRRLRRAHRRRPR